MKLGYQDQAEDRLSLLPDALLISIFSYIDTRLAVQCSVLSKRWVNLWTLIPVLNFDPLSFVYRDRFDIFIDMVLAGRDGLIKVDSVNLKIGCHDHTVPRVFDYALLHGVRNVSIHTRCRILCSNSSDFLTNLSLKGWQHFGKCLNFNGLVSLRLEEVMIINEEPFSSFPNLENLTLVNCRLWYYYCWNGLEVISTQLSRLTISSCYSEPIPYKKLALLTPKLVLLELKGLLPKSVEAFELPDLDTAHIDCFSDFITRSYIHCQKLSLITVLRGLRHAMYIHLSPSTVELLSRSHKMLVKEHFQFDNLKVLNLLPPKNESPGTDVYSSVAANLLKDCPQAVFKSLPPNVIEGTRQRRKHA